MTNQCIAPSPLKKRTLQFNKHKHSSARKPRSANVRTPPSHLPSRFIILPERGMQMNFKSGINSFLDWIGRAKTRENGVESLWFMFNITSLTSKRTGAHFAPPVPYFSINRSWWLFAPNMKVSSPIYVTVKGTLHVRLLQPGWCGTKMERKLNSLFCLLLARQTIKSETLKQQPCIRVVLSETFCQWMCWAHCSACEKRSRRPCQDHIQKGFWTSFVLLENIRISLCCLWTENCFWQEICEVFSFKHFCSLSVPPFFSVESVNVEVIFPEGQSSLGPEEAPHPCESYMCLNTSSPDANEPWDWKKNHCVVANCSEKADERAGASESIRPRSTKIALVTAPYDLEIRWDRTALILPHFNERKHLELQSAARQPWTWNSHDHADASQHDCTSIVEIRSMSGRERRIDPRLWNEEVFSDGQMYSCRFLSLFTWFRHPSEFWIWMNIDFLCPSRLLHDITEVNGSLQGQRGQLAVTFSSGD